MLTLATSLHGIARTLAERIAPALDDPFAAEASRLAQLLLTISANAVDDAAAIRIEENAAVRVLFADAAALVDDGLADWLREAAASRDPGYRISELDREGARLRALLVELHAAVEALPGAAARALDGRIWALLAEVEAKRAPRA